MFSALLLLRGFVADPRAKLPRVGAEHDSVVVLKEKLRRPGWCVRVEILIP
jgi:hypothetical protein